MKEENGQPFRGSESDQPLPKVTLFPHLQPGFGSIANPRLIFSNISRKFPTPHFFPRPAEIAPQIQPLAPAIEGSP